MRKNFGYAALGSALPAPAQIVFLPTVKAIIQNNTSNKGSEKGGDVVGTTASTVTSAVLNKTMKGDSLYKVVFIEGASYVVGNKVKNTVTNIIQTPNEPIYQIMTPDIQQKLNNFDQKVSELNKLKANTYNK